MFAKIALIAAALGPARAVRIVDPTADAAANNAPAVTAVLTNANPEMAAGVPVAVTLPNQETVQHGMLRGCVVRTATPGWPTYNPALSRAAVEQSGGAVVAVTENSVVQFERDGQWRDFDAERRVKLLDMHAKWTQTRMNARDDKPAFCGSDELEAKMTAHAQSRILFQCRDAGFWFKSAEMVFVPVDRFGEITHFFDFDSMTYHVIFTGDLYAGRANLSRRFRLV